MKSRTANEITILYAEDDKEDQMLVKEALEESRLLNPIDCVGDGEELMDYLLHQGKYAGLPPEHRPGLILLDLNMPRMDGREALTRIKADEDLRRIPVCVLTTSDAEEDIVKTYNLGVSGYIRKPVTFETMVGIVQTLGKYYFEIVELPN